jgi:hypothetical protein
MALRVARGLFRLWLVLSVLWIGGVAVVTWRSLPEDEFILPSERGPAAPSTGMFDDLIPKRETVRAFDPSKPYTKVREKERWEAVRLASVVALLPPAFLLALGSALVWAFRGFR